MSYQGPVGDHSPDPYEKYRVDRIEADKQTKGDHPPPFEDPKSSSFALVAYLLALFHKFLKVFQYADSKGIATTTEQTVRANLLLLKEAFELLKREDKSQDAPFLNHLAALWHTALEDILLFRKEAPIAQPFKILIQDIDTYPKGEEFTFGYYLIEYAGQKWLPFPYMELVHNIYAQHQRQPESSSLTRWTTWIDELMQKMDPT